jgi:hypothetical protein
MKKKFILASIFLSATLPTMALAQKAQKQTSAPETAPKKSIAVALTAEQTTKMAEDQKKFQAEMLAFKKELDVKRNTYDELYASDASEDDVRKAHAELQKVMDKMQKRGFEQMMKQRATTPSQVRKESLKMQRAERARFEAETNAPPAKPAHK